MGNVAGTRENEMLGSEIASFLHTAENEKERYARQLLDGAGKKITSTVSVKRKKPMRVRIKQLLRRLFKKDRKELEKKMNEIEKDMLNYKP